MIPRVNQYFECDTVPAAVMDELWAEGWRHFGEFFFRYDCWHDGDALLRITPLRMALAEFSATKSQRRVLRKNADLRCEFAPAKITDAARGMFHRHKARFKDQAPDDLETFLSRMPALVPCHAVQCEVYAAGELVALSYLDLGEVATSAVYGMFEPGEAWRSLGIFTMLKEIEFSRERGCRYYYPGYATQEPSAYDYKKGFGPLETLDWHTGHWGPLTPSLAPPSCVVSSDFENQTFNLAAP